MGKYTVIHVTEDSTQSNFGVATAIFELIVRSKGFCDLKIIASGTGKPLREIAGIELKSSPIAWWGKVWRYAPNLLNNLDNKQCSVIHIHGVWMAPQFMAARYAIRHSIPFVITPHNMLGGWLWHRGKIRQFKKTLYWRCLVEPVFRHASIVHALTSEEHKTLKEFFPCTRIVTIPNGIDLDDIRRQISGVNRLSDKYLLFLGRLHPVKGLELLFYAIAKMPKWQRIRLIVAGTAASESYDASLKKLVYDLGIEKTVEFVGLVVGDRKWALLSGAWVVCAPSYSEGMSMVALEAMACSTPIITTYAAGLPEIAEWGGELINPDVEELMTALEQVIAWSSEDRENRGKMAFELVRCRYSWDVVAQDYNQLYQQAMGLEH